MHRIVGVRLRCLIDKPAAIEAFRVVFIRTGEVPTLVPVFYPGVVAALVPPQRSADSAGGNTDSAAGIDEDDGEAGAGCLALFDGFFRRLVRAFPLRVIVGFYQFEKITIEDLRCLGGSFRVLHKQCRFR